MTNCDKMLNFVNFENGGTCVHRRILDVMFRVLSNRLMSKLSDTLFGDENRTIRLLLVLTKIDKL